jgi:hypothetical protein
MGHTFIVALGFLQWALLFSGDTRKHWLIPILAALTVIVHPGGVIIVGVTFLLYLAAQRPPQALRPWIPVALVFIMVTGYGMNKLLGFTPPGEWNYFSMLIDNLKYMYAFFVQYDVLYSLFRDSITHAYKALHTAHYIILVIHFIGFILLTCLAWKAYSNNSLSKNDKRIIESILFASMGVFFVSQIVLFPAVTAIIFVRVAPILIVFMLTLIFIVCKKVFEKNSKNALTTKKWMTLFLSALFIIYLSQRGLLAYPVLDREIAESNINYADNVFDSFNQGLKQDDLVLFETMGPLYYSLTNGLRTTRPVVGFIFNKQQIESGFGDIRYVVIDSPYAKTNSGNTISYKGRLRIPPSGSLRLAFPDNESGEPIQFRIPEGRGHMTIRSNGNGPLSLSDQGEWLTVENHGAQLILHAEGAVVIDAIRLSPDQHTRWPWNRGVTLEWTGGAGEPRSFDFETAKSSPFVQGKDFVVEDDTSDFVILRRAL